MIPYFPHCSNGFILGGGFLCLGDPLRVWVGVWAGGFRAQGLGFGLRLDTAPPQ